MLPLLAVICLYQPTINVALESVRWPSHETCERQRRFASEYYVAVHDNELHYGIHRKTRSHDDAEWRYEIWVAVTNAQDQTLYTDQRLRAFATLRELLGEQMWWGGNLPNPRPE